MSAAPCSRSELCSHPALLVGGAGGALVARWELLGARLPRVLGLRPGGVQGGGQGAERAAAGLADDQHDEQIGCAAPPPLALRLATGAERLRLAAFAGFGLGESARSEDKTARSKQATFGARSSSAFSSPETVGAENAAVCAGVFERLYAEAYKEPNFAQKRWEDTCKRKSIQPQWRPVRTGAIPPGLCKPGLCFAPESACSCRGCAGGLPWLTETAAPVCSCRRTVRNRR